MKVLSIVGPGRSGSTLFAEILGEIPGVLDMGELRWLWRRGLQEGRPCGCGVVPADCPLWSRVLVEMFGEVPRGDGSSAADREVAGVVAAQRRLAVRAHRMRAIRSASRDVGDWPDLTLVREATARLIAALAATTDARVLVDASKRPLDAAVLASMWSVDHYVLHLVRDPRAVAFSWGRVKELATGSAAPRHMAQRGLVGASGRWMENNLGTELLRRHVPPARWLHVRYEDFVVDPSRELSRVSGLLGEAAAPPLGDHSVVLGTNHTVAGNPVRFRTGPVTISLDDEWRRAMTPRQKAVVTAVTLPLLTRYGYPVAPGT